MVLWRYARDNVLGAREVLESLCNSRSDGAIEVLEQLAREGALVGIHILERLTSSRVQDAIDMIEMLARDNVHDCVEILERIAKKGDQEALKIIGRIAEGGNEKAIESLCRLALDASGRQNIMKMASKIFIRIATDARSQFILALLQKLAEQKKHHGAEFECLTSLSEMQVPGALNVLCNLARSRKEDVSKRAMVRLTKLAANNIPEIFVELSRLARDSIDGALEVISSLSDRNILALEALALLVRERVPAALEMIENLAKRTLRLKVSRKTYKLIEIFESFDNIEDTSQEILDALRKKCKHTTPSHTIFTVLGTQYNARLNVLEKEFSPRSTDLWFSLMKELRNDGRSWDEIAKLQEAMNSVPDNQEIFGAVLAEYKSRGIESAFELIEAIKLSKETEETWWSKISFADMAQIFFAIVNGIVYDASSVIYPFYPHGDPGGDPGGGIGEGLIMQSADAGLVMGNMTISENYTYWRSENLLSVEFIGNSTIASE